MNGLGRLKLSNYSSLELLNTEKSLYESIPAVTIGTYLNYDKPDYIKIYFFHLLFNKKLRQTIECTLKSFLSKITEACYHFVKSFSNQKLTPRIGSECEQQDYLSGFFLLELGHFWGKDRVMHLAVVVQSKL